MHKRKHYNANKTTRAGFDRRLEISVIDSMFSWILWFTRRRAMTLLDHEQHQFRLRQAARKVWSKPRERGEGRLSQRELINRDWMLNITVEIKIATSSNLLKFGTTIIIELGTHVTGKRYRHKKRHNQNSLTYKCIFDAMQCSGHIRNPQQTIYSCGSSYFLLVQHNNERMRIWRKRLPMRK